MTIIVHFPQSNYRYFKYYYQQHVQKYLKDYFPELVSYNRFVELKKFALIPFLLQDLQRTITNIQKSRSNEHN